MAGITINPTFDAVYTATGKNFTEAREASVADSIETRLGDYDISIYGTLTITRVYMEFDLSSVGMEPLLFSQYLQIMILKIEMRVGLLISTLVLVQTHHI